MSIQSLDQRFAIVGPDGRPTDYFMRLIRDRGQAQSDTSETVSELQTRKINTGSGLAGGGDLSADRILTLDAGIDLLTDVDTTTTPPTNGQRLVWNSGSGLWIPGGTIGGGLIGYQVIAATGSGTYTPTTGTVSIVIELQGGGGGGGGVAATSGTSTILGSGGSGGAYLRKRLTSNFSGASYSVGTGGAGGAAGNNNGNNGGDTTFTNTAGSPTTFTAGGGQGGSRLGPTTGPFIGLTVAGGSAANGDINVGGGPASAPLTTNSNANNLGAPGGASQFSRGAQGVTGPGNSSGVGLAAAGYGGGGGGAIASGSAIARAGGNGSAGIIIIWEYAS